MIITILIVTFNIFLIIFPRIVLNAAREGLLLWFHNVLPSLLPFIIATNILIALGFSKFLGKILAPMMEWAFKLPGIGGFALVTGLTSGYPMGAKTIADLYRDGELTTRESQHLLAFCNNAGPLFIVGVVGVGLFGSTRIGYILWMAHILAALILGLILTPRKKLTFSSNASFLQAWKEFRAYKPAFGTVLGNAVKNAMESLVFIGGLIIFFSVVVAVIGEVIDLDNSIFSGILAGIFEVTGGVQRLSVLGEVNVFILAAAAFVVAFGGLSIHAQTFHFVGGIGIKTLPYLMAKFFHGVIAAGLTVIFLAL